MARRDRHNLARTYRLSVVTHKWEGYHSCGGFPRGARGLSPTLGSSAQGAQYLALKTNRAYVWESPRAVGNQDCFEGVSHKLTCSKSQHPGNSWKSTWVTGEGG